MAIDPKLVKWDEESVSSPKIDPRMVKWEDVQNQPQDASANFGMANPAGTLRNARTLLGGWVRGAGDIGATLLQPIDSILDDRKGQISKNQQRRQDMTGALQDLGIDTDSTGFKGARLGAQIMGTAGTGGIFANGARLLIPASYASRAAPFLAAVESGGMNTGANSMGLAANIGTRAAGGAINGALSAGLVNPDDAASGAGLGALLPTVVRGGGALGGLTSNALSATSKKLMQSALKPIRSDLKSGDAAIAVQALLDNGLNVSKGGVEKLRNMIGNLNDDITSRISNSNATIDKQKVLDSLGGVRQKFQSQVDPMPDLNAIQGVADRFSAHPSLPTDQIPVQLAQELKQGTYKVLSKKYGQLGSADTEAQKSLARGLKEGIADAVPEIGSLNAQESKLIKTLNVTERRVLQQLNNNPVGLAGLAKNPAAWAAMMADKSAVFKSLAARSANNASQGLSAFSNQFGMLENPIVRTGLLNLETSQ
jgi:hypothetical protein